METRFVYFFIVLALPAQQCTNLHFWGQTDVIKKIKTYFNVIFRIILQLDLQQAFWSHQVERGTILFQA